MFNVSGTSTPQSMSFCESQDTKYTVAELLSSLASGGGELTSTYTTTSSSSAPPFSSGTGLAGTPLLTPSTLASLEQTFLDAQQQNNPLAGVQYSTAAPISLPITQLNNTIISSASSSLNHTVLDLSRESGFVPPVIDPVSNLNQTIMVKQEPSSDYYEDSSSMGVDPDWQQSSAKRMCLGQDAPSASPVMAKPQYTSTAMAPNPTPRRHTGPRPRKTRMLTPEEDARRRVRRERNKMAAAKCRQRRVDLTNTLLEESEGLEDNKVKLESEIQNLQHQKEQLEFLLEAHKPLCGSKALKQQASVTTSVGVAQTVFSSAAMMAPSSAPSTSGILGTLAYSGSSSSQRPNSLPLARTLTSLSTAVTNATGIPITTPSNGVNVFTLGLESMMDGHTGLTPITGAPSCSSQVHRSSSDSASSPSDTLSSPTLLAL